MRVCAPINQINQPTPNLHTPNLTLPYKQHEPQTLQINREEGEFGEALVGKKVRVFRPEQLRYVEVSKQSERAYVYVYFFKGCVLCHKRHTHTYIYYM